METTWPTKPFHLTITSCIPLLKCILNFKVPSNSVVISCYAHMHSWHHEGCYFCTFPKISSFFSPPQLFLNKDVDTPTLSGDKHTREELHFLIILVIIKKVLKNGEKNNVKHAVQYSLAYIYKHQQKHWNKNRQQLKVLCLAVHIFSLNHFLNILTWNI